MSLAISTYQQLQNECLARGVTLVAVSKTKPVNAILQLYELGHRDFGENYVQELVDKQGQLPTDIRWHFIGHLQSNKVKAIAPFIHLIQSADSLKLLKEINKEAGKCGRVISVLIQVHVAQEDTKFGWAPGDLPELWKELSSLSLPYIRLAGIMGMATFTENVQQLRSEFQQLKQAHGQLADFLRAHPEWDTVQPLILSMGMSGDYTLAIEEGSTLVRIGSLLFGARS
ncbi:MAG: YggS family pyridoxal phosphate-dependent enzyme [Chitinophagaceae bacterium]